MVLRRGAARRPAIGATLPARGPAMTLSPAERAEVNRQNARKSTGPRTAEGKLRSRENALRTGLRAVVLTLPGEDPEAVAERAREWLDHDEPQTPEAVQLAFECARASIQCDRVSRYQTE